MTYLPSLSSFFVIRNITNKDIRIFGVYTLKAGREADLFKAVPNLTESRLLEDLTSGDLDLEINKKGSLVVESHNLTSLRALMNQGREDYRNPDGPVTIYVRTTGDDLTGDGSAEKPYRQPLKACTDIPTLATGIFFIDCGPGDFEFPVLPPSPPGARIVFRGDVSSPLTASDDDSFVVDAEEPGHYNATFPEYSGAIVAGTHWLRRMVAGFDVGYTLSSSESPAIKLVNNTHFMSGTLEIHAFATKFYVTDRWNYSGYPTIRLGEGTSFVGIDIVNNVSLAKFSGLQFTGCKLSGVDALFAEGLVSIYRDGAATVLGGGHLITQMVSSIVTGDLRASGCVNIAGVALGRRLVINSDIAPSYINLGHATFLESDQDCVFAGGDFVTQNYATLSCLIGDIRVHPSRPRLWASSLNFINDGGSNRIRGSTTGIPITATDGAQLKRIKLSCAGTLTNSTNAGQDIVVGGNAVVAFAALPTTDVGAASPQFCRAT